MKTGYWMALAIALWLIASSVGAEPAANNPQQISGIGVKLTQSSQGVLIEGVLPGSPAERAELQAGERILAVDGVSVTDVREATKKIVGPEGSEVSLLVAGTDGQVRTVKVTRGKIQLGARSLEDFAGSFMTQQDPPVRITITHLEMNRFRLECEAEHWKGFGLLYINSQFNAYHMKGIYQVGNTQDVPEQMREVVGYFRIDCITAGMLQIKRAWNLAGDSQDQTTTVVMVRHDAGEEAGPNVEQPEAKAEGTNAP